MYQNLWLDQVILLKFLKNIEMISALRELFSKLLL